MRRIALFFAMCAVVWTANLGAQQTDSVGNTKNPSQVSPPVPRLIMYAGTLKDPTGEPLTGTVDLTFAIYKRQTDPECLWQETQTLNLDEQGHYSAVLGATEPEGLPTELFTTGQARWLGVSARQFPEQPRILLVSVPYALESNNAQMLGGKPASAYALAQPVESTTSSTSQAGPTAVARGAVAALEAVKSIKPTSGLSPYLSETGEAGYIPMYSNPSLDLGNSIIFQYGSRIGIGTRTPSYGFDLNSNVFAIGPTAAKPGAGGTMRFRDDSATVRWSLGVPGSAGATDFFLYNNVNGRAPFYIQAGAAPYSLYLNSNGNVGIGTTAPVQKLDVMGSVRINGTGNAIIFPDNTVMTSAGAGTNGGTITKVTAGTGLSGGGTAGPVTLGLATSSCTPGFALTGLPFTCQPFATLGSNSFNGNLSVAASSGSTIQASSSAGSGNGAAGYFVNTNGGHILDAGDGNRVLLSVDTNGVHFKRSLGTLPNDPVNASALHELITVNQSTGTAKLAGPGNSGGMIPAGIVVAGAGTSAQSAEVIFAMSGDVQCAFDNTASNFHFVQISSTTAGYCHDAGSNWPTTGGVLGIVNDTTKTPPQIYLFGFGVGVRPETIATNTNCASNSSPAACGSANAGSISLTSTVTVNTTAVTANSQIMLQEDNSLGARLGVTCTPSYGITYMVSGRTPGTSFSITPSNSIGDTRCVNWVIVN